VLIGSYLGAGGSGQTQEGVHGVVLSGVEEGLVVLGKRGRRHERRLQMLIDPL